VIWRSTRQMQDRVADELSGCIQHGRSDESHGAGSKSTPLFHNGSSPRWGSNGIVSAFDGVRKAAVAEARAVGAAIFRHRIFADAIAT